MSSAETVMSAVIMSANMDIPKSETANNVLSRIGHLSPPSTRLMCGPGPANISGRVYSAMARPMVGHMDPEFLKVASDVATLLRFLWDTANEFTFALSGSAMAAWEALVANLTSRGEVHLIVHNGYFATRAEDISRRYGALVVLVEVPWGQAASAEVVATKIHEIRPAMVWACHAETCTGVLQPRIDAIGKACRETGALFLLDTVTSLGGVPVHLDAWFVDAAYSGGQKCLGCPPGIAPLTMNERCLAKLRQVRLRDGPCRSWYLDLHMIADYLSLGGSKKRVYQATAPISMNYALREALTELLEEGPENAVKRNLNTSLLFEALVLRELPEVRFAVKNRELRVPHLNTLYLPTDINIQKLCQTSLLKYNLELGQGLGVFADKVIRVGLMGQNARPEIAIHVVAVIKKLIEEQRSHNNI